MARVLLVSDGTLFGRGMEALLAGLQEVEIVGWTTDPQQASERVDALQPDVLVLSCACPDEVVTPSLLGCLEAGRIQKIVSVDLRDNSVTVLTSERRAVDEVENLVEAITGATGSS